LNDQTTGIEALSMVDACWQRLVRFVVPDGTGVIGEMDEPGCAIACNQGDALVGCCEHGCREMLGADLANGADGIDGGAGHQ